MNRFIRIVALPALYLVAALARAGAAPAELAGTWQGKLNVDPRTSITIQFTFAKQPNGSYTAVLNSPDNGAIKNTPATGVTWDGSKVKLDVASLSGSYAGALKDGKLDGQWTQQGSALPLVLSPYQKPVLTKAAMDTLSGGWTGAITVAGTTQNIVFNFKPDAKGELQGTFSIPDQGLNDTPVSDILFENNKLSLKVPRVNLELNGTLANNVINSKLKIPSPAIPADGLDVSLKRGAYTPPVHALKLDVETFAKLNGTWKGPLELTAPNGQKRTINLILRVATSASGQYVAFIDSPDQGASNLAVTEMSLTGDKLALKVDAVKGEYSATLAGKTMTGEWVQGGGAFKAPLVLKQ